MMENKYCIVVFVPLILDAKSQITFFYEDLPASRSLQILACMHSLSNPLKSLNMK